MNVFIFRPNRCPSHIKSGHLPTKLLCNIWPQGLFNGHIGEVYSNGSRRAQLHPAIWLGSIGAHSHGELAEGGGREEEMKEEEEGEGRR